MISSIHNYDFLFTCSSWEDRFIQGLEHTIKSNSINKVSILAIEEFVDRTAENRAKATAILDHELQHDLMPISIRDDLVSWNAIKEYIGDLNFFHKKVLIDLSTMPRYLVWFMLHFLQMRDLEIHYIYYSPRAYSNDWLCADPGMPRLVLKHSGISLPDQKTVLLIQTGFDFERASQLITMFEPEKVLFAVQVGEQFDNLERNISRRKEQLGYPDNMVNCFSIDSFSGDHGYAEIENSLEPYGQDHNIIMCSLGPKLTSIALFKLNLQHPEYGLVYAPAKEYNKSYSSGIDLDNIQKGTII